MPIWMAGALIVPHCCRRARLSAAAAKVMDSRTPAKGAIGMAYPGRRESDSRIPLPPAGWKFDVGFLVGSRLPRRATGPTTLGPVVKASVAPA